MPDYLDILNQAQHLTLDEQLRLLEDLAAHNRRQITRQPKHSIMEFKGLGKEIWQSIDVEKYINEERTW